MTRTRHTFDDVVLFTRRLDDVSPKTWSVEGDVRGRGVKSAIGLVIEHASAVYGQLPVYGFTWSHDWQELNDARPIEHRRRPSLDEALAALAAGVRDHLANAGVVADERAV